MKPELLQKLTEEEYQVPRLYNHGVAVIDKHGNIMLLVYGTWDKVAAEAERRRSAGVTMALKS
jgi:hypothetical protein